MTTTQHEKETMLVEIERVQRLIAEAINQIETDGGSLRYLNAALMSAAMVMHSEIEGPQTLDAAMTKTAQRVLVAKGAVGQC